MKLFYRPNIIHLTSSAATQVIYRVTTVKTKKKNHFQATGIFPTRGSTVTHNSHISEKNIHTMHNDLKGNL